MINHLVQQRYEVVEKVGDSALFTVYKARDRVNSQVVALKTVQAAFQVDTAFLAELGRSMPASAELNHPNIARFHELGEDDRSVFLISDFVRGIDLKERVRRIAPFTLSVAIDFAIAIGEALHYAHKLGQPHGDLRPQNVIISPEGSLKVTDFGVQRAIAASPSAQALVLARSAPYHAPELSTAQPGTVAGDIYALGATLYEMLTGAPVYAGETVEAVAEQHALAPIPSPRVISPGVPRAVEGIVLKCLQKRPDQRYQSAAEALRDLKSVRDALRFGKSLSWSPIETEEPAAAPPPAATKAKTYPVPARGGTAPAPEYQAAPMPTQTRMRAEAERVSFFLRSLLMVMTTIILCLVFGMIYVWVTKWSVPKPETLPQLVGKPIDEVRTIVTRLKLHPLEHADYLDLPRGVVYQTDPKAGAETRPGHVINIWFSYGPKYVNVPNLVGLQKDDAVQQLTDAGLTAGSIMPEYSNTVPQGAVIRQNVSSKKRVIHGQVVDLVISDGPKPDYAAEPGNGDSTGQTPATGADAAQPGTTAPDATSPDATGGAQPGNPAQPPVDDTPHHFDRTISIPHDHLGEREVKILYHDSTDPAGVDHEFSSEMKNEGDKVPVSFDYRGKTITLTIEYNGRQVWQRTFDPEATPELDGQMSATEQVQIAPSLLSADFGRLADAAREAERAGAEYLHFDVMDGHFVPNLTMGPAAVKALRPVSSALFDVHLMITDPDRFVPMFAEAGADSITVQAEACLHLQRTLAEIRALGKRAGVALNPATPPDVLQYVLDDIDLVLVMTVNPGFGGQKFLPAVLPKIAAVRQLIAKAPHPIEIEVDGGIAPDTAPEVVRQGARVLVAGSAVYGHAEGVAARVAALRAAARGGLQGA